MACLKISALLTVLYIVFVCVPKFGSPRARSLVEEEKDLERQLSILNKPAVLSFKTNCGIYDCVDIYKQPAFDNPLLKNHKLQTKPSGLPIIQQEESQPELRWDEQVNPFKETGINCPDGTVPIRRTAKEDLIRQNSSVGIQRIGLDPFSSKEPNTYFAVLKFKEQQRLYLSAQSSMTIHNPNHKNGATGAQIWVYSGDDYLVNYISAGWMVNPDLYGDGLTHFTAYWKGDQVGCANMQCQGFVQTDNQVPLGYAFSVVSGPGHPKIFPVRIALDRAAGKWWLSIGPDLKTIGYWPKELFSMLQGGGDHIAFGGVVKSKPPVVTPEMGSGRAYCRFNDTAYFRHIVYSVAKDNVLRPDWSMTENHVDCPTTYTVQHQCGEPELPDFAFLYGGEGGCTE